jgi:hypothetical protein
MRSNLKSFLIKALFRTTLFLSALVAVITVLANDGKRPSSVAVKGSVPVNYYQAFMISVAVAYGIYLIVRARRRKRNGKISD